MNKINQKTVFLFFCFFVFPLMTHAFSQTQYESDQQISDFSLSGFGERGRKTWDLSGKSADIFTDNIKLKDIVGNLYGKEEDIRLTADQGDFDKREGRVHLEQNVVITTSSGASLLTDSLDWDRKNQLVSTKDVVNIEKESMITVAQGAQGRPNLKKITLDKDVTTKIDAAGGEAGNDKTADGRIVITCDGPLEIDYEKNVAVFNNNVKVDKGDAQIFSDRMDVYFSGSGNPDAAKAREKAGDMASKIKKIVSRGNVRIVNGPNVSYSEEAVYTAEDKKITLVGRPKLIIESTEGLSSASFGN